jgi:hypothetical protein
MGIPSPSSLLAFALPRPIQRLPTNQITTK